MKFTRFEKRTISRLRNEGLSYKAVAKSMGRRKADVIDVYHEITGEPKKTIFQPGVPKTWKHDYIDPADLGRTKKYYTWNFQLELIADYRETKSPYSKKSNITSYSLLHPDLESKDQMMAEAVEHARGQLGGSNWRVEKIRSKKYMRWQAFKK